MKRIAFCLILSVLLLSSCGKEDTPANTTNTVVPQRNIPTGTISNPGWDVAPGYDYTSSMTADVSVDLTSTYPELTSADWQLDTADRLAAFAGSECIGVTSLSQYDNLFFLYILSPSASDADISLRYYSARLHNIFQADTLLHFENGARIGSVADPLTPAFVEFKTEN
jgi:hypothetical protein